MNEVTKINRKDTNPKDAIGAAKWRNFFTVPQRVLWEIGVGMLEGALKYGRHNYRPAGVRASVYIDATMGHISQWVEGEDLDPDTKINHITKAICSLMVLRDGMLEGNFIDDRPPRHKSLDEHRDFLQQKVTELLAQYPVKAEPFTEEQEKAKRAKALVNAE